MLCIVSAIAIAATFQRPNLFPWPNSIKSLGHMASFTGLEIRADPGLDGEKRAAAEILGKRGRTSGFLRLRLNRSLKNLGAEGYRLEVDGRGVLIAAPASAGVFYGLQTLRQMVHKTAGRIVIPEVQISDRPRFPWRGAMLDVSRHFFPKKDIIHLLDLFSQYKINTFHMHLVDDGGWRLEIKKYPKLTEVGAWRLPSDGTFPEYTGLDFPGPASGKRLYGGFYSQRDIRDIVRYAADRHITVVPEIEMPGHNLAATMSYPWLVCSPDLKDAYRKEYGFAFPNVFCAGKESTFKFVEDVLDEVMALFPSKVIHIGGDEVDKFLWTRCDDCKKRMADLGLKAPEQLESYFVQRVEKYANAHGREIIGWDEILEGGLAQNAKVMSWHGESGGIAAAKLGHQSVMTPWDQCYFDHSNAELPIDVPLSYDPTAGMTAKEAKYVLGAQANVWTETLPTIADLEDRFFPRILALSQALWTVKKEPADSFIARLNGHLPELFEKAPGLHLSGPFTPLTVVEPGVHVPVSAPAIEGATVRYTLDGTTPTQTSPVYSSDVVPREGQSLRLALASHRRVLSDVTRVVACSLAQATPHGTLPGLQYKVFAGAFSALPEFKELTPSEEGASDGVGLKGKLKDNYALEFTGYLVIPKDGTYALHCGSDDGSAVWLSGTKIIDNDGPHGFATGTARLKLKAGMYPIAVGYFQALEGADLKLEIEGPGISRRPLGGTLLRH